MNAFSKIPAIERKSPEEIQKFQLKQLKQELEYLSRYSKYYKRLFQKYHIEISKIKTLEDLKNVPLTSKEDLQKYNKDFICVPAKDIVDYMTTSGTLGEPVTFAATNHDLERLAYNEAISFACAGATSKDIFQIMTTLDRRFMAGIAYFLGLRKLGAGIIRVGQDMLELHWDSILRFKPTYIIAVPSFILKLVDYAEKNGIDYKSSSVRNAVCIGEPIRNFDMSLNTLGQRITDKWKINLFSTYASTEMGAAFTECIYHNGGHHHPELIITEILDEHGNAVEQGVPGELVITTLGVEAMPLLRFKTGDVCAFYTEPCPCGRNTIRLGPVIGRKQQMIKYKGTTLFPSAIYNVLDAFDNVENYAVEVFTNELGTDEIVVHVGCKKESDEMREKLSAHFRAKIRVVPQIVFRDVHEIHRMINPPSSRKQVKFIDRRNK